MNTFQSIIFVTITGNAIVGLLVWLSNPERKLNRYFLLTTFLITNWLSCMFAITFQTAENLLFWTRQVSAAAVFLPVGFFILQSVISSPEITLKSLLYKIRYLLIAAITVAVMCQTKSFVTTTYFSNPSETVPLSEYGTTFIIYILYFCAMVIGMMVSIRQTFINSSGVQRIESQFLLLGWLFSFSFGLILYTVSIIAGRQEVTRFLPLFAFVMDGFVAYGIATRRILAVSVVVQRFVAYILLAVYLILTYMATEWLIDVGFHYVIPDTSYLSHLAAALAVAFSMIPANNWMHRFSYRLFSSSNPFDMDRVLTESEVILQEVSTESTLLAAFSDFITHTFRTTEITLLEKNDDDSFSERCSFPNQHRRKQISLKPFSSLIQLINRDRESFTVDTLERMRATPLVINARSEMKEAGATVAIGCFLHKKLQMIVLLHRKTNGAIYDLREQQTLQRLCNQLAVALENARLYTAVQDGKIYNEILLDSLTSGIIAINESRKVMVFNQRAQTITQLSDKDIVNESIEKLPAALAELADNILTSGFGVRDVDLFIEPVSSKIPIRVSGSAFHSYKGEKLGVLLVFSDMTLLRKMEEQIRLSDRLSSIGTLSAGMAHEIKNPLVTIKTFTELLPEQHNNPDFRDTFFDLVSQEVQRIDSIVTRLLHFARPAKASLKPTHLHDVIKNAILLIEQQLSKNRIKLKKNLSAECDLVMADSEQINQALINFFLNAIQAMEPGGMLSIKTSQSDSTFYINVNDTGCGLSEEQKKCIFDPFFTTKETGVGLGLSISHGIIQEHQGEIIVESVKGEGTTFHIELPLAKEEEI